MHLKNARRFTRTLIILGVGVGSSLAVYAALVVTLGLGQPLMLVASNSMEPTMQLGDIIAVRAVAPAQVGLGSVLVYQKDLNGIMIIHRVVCVVTSTDSKCVAPWYPYFKCYAPPCYYTKGDNELGPDPWVVLSNQVVGTWTGFRIPYFGMALICLRQDSACPSPWGPISLVALGSSVASEVGLEYWISRRTQKCGIVKPSSTEVDA